MICPISRDLVLNQSPISTIFQIARFLFAPTLVLSGDLLYHKNRIFPFSLNMIFLLLLQPFNNWLDGTREDLVDMFIVHTLDEIQGLIDAHAQFKATLGEADKEFQAIIALIHEVEGFAKQYNVPGANINPYTNLTGSVRFS